MRAWRSRGGSWYGIGYFVRFAYLEITMTLSELSDAGSAVEFFDAQAGEFVGRWFGESIANMVQAFLWPLTLIENLGVGMGVVLLLGIHFGFEHFVRPLAEARFPELAQDRVAREDKKRESQEKKQAKRKG